MYDLINAPLPKLPKSVKLAVKAKEECLMKKSVILCMVAFVLISVFVGCSVKNSDVNENAETSSFSASKETTLPISTAENDTKADTTNTATVNTKENANVNSSEKTSGVEIDKTAKASTNKRFHQIQRLIKRYKLTKQNQRLIQLQLSQPKSKLLKKLPLPQSRQPQRNILLKNLLM